MAQSYLAVRCAAFCCFAMFC